MSLFYSYSHHHHQRLDALIDRSYRPFGSYFRQQPALSSLDDTTRQWSRWVDQTHRALSSSASNCKPLSTPSFAVEDTEDAYIIEGSIPGINEDDMTVHVVDNTTLTIRGQTDIVQRDNPTPSDWEAHQIPHPTAPTPEKDSPVTTDQTTDPSTEPSTPEASHITTSPITQPLQKQSHTPASKQSPRYRVTHRAISQFQRTFRLPDGIDRTTMTTYFKEGKLRIVVLKPNTNVETVEAGLETSGSGSDPGTELQSRSQSKVQGEGCDRDDHHEMESMNDHGLQGRDESGGESSVSGHRTNSNSNRNNNDKGKARKVEIETVDDED